MNDMENRINNIDEEHCVFVDSWDAVLVSVLQSGFYQWILLTRWIALSYLWWHQQQRWHKDNDEDEDAVDNDEEDKVGIELDLESQNCL